MGETIVQSMKVNMLLTILTIFAIFLQKSAESKGNMTNFSIEYRNPFAHIHDLSFGKIIAKTSVHLEYWARAW